MVFKERRTYGRFLAQFCFLNNMRFRTDCTGLYLQGVSTALARLTPEQLALRAAPNLRSIEELAHHIIAVRAGWFHYQLEEGGEELRAFTTWGEPESSPRSAEELVSGLEHTWRVIQDVLGRYTLADLRSTVQDEWNGKIHDLSRGWVLWHVLQHDLHHGGEIAYSLGMHGLAAPSNTDLYGE